MVFSCSTYSLDRLVYMCTYVQHCYMHSSRLSMADVKEQNLISLFVLFRALQVLVWSDFSQLSHS